MTLESSGAGTSILAAALRCQPLLFGTRQLISAYDLNECALFLHPAGLLIAPPL
jgi:hypothetical protein